MKIKNIFVSVITLVSISISLNSEQIKPDAYYQFIKYEYILNSDGSITFNYEHNLKMLSYFAVNRAYGETFITYNPNWQYLKVTKSNTIMADGNEVKSPFNAYNEVLPGEAGNAAPYMNLREMVVTHAGLERNCEVNLAYTIETKKGFIPGLIGKIIIGKNEPVQNFEIILKVPKDTKLNLFMSNSGPMGDKITKDNFDIYHWKLKDLPLIPIESGQPELEEFMPTLYFSTATNSDIAGNILGNEEELCKLSENSKKAINEIIKDNLTNSDKCFALQEYVYSSIGLTDIDISYLGYRALKAQETFDRNVGSFLDRAVLLTSMCRAAGIDADLAITAEFSNSKPDISLLSQFSDYLVYCKPENESDMPVLLDPNHKQSKTIPSALQNKPAFVINSKKLYLIPAIPESNILVFHSHMSIGKPGEIIGTANLSLSGNYLPARTTGECDKAIQNYYNNLSWNIEDSNTAEAVSYSNSFRKNMKMTKDKMMKLDDIYEFNLPSAPNSADAMHLKPIPATRITPYKLPFALNEEYHFEIEIPDSMSFISLPAEIKIDNPTGSVVSSFKQNGNKLVVNRKLNISNQIISPENYHHFYKLFSVWNEKKNKVIYFK